MARTVVAGPPGPISQLPNELLIIIFLLVLPPYAHVSYGDSVVFVKPRVILMLVCQQWCTVIKSPVFWPLFNFDYPARFLDWALQRCGAIPRNVVVTKPIEGDKVSLFSQVREKSGQWRQLRVRWNPATILFQSFPPNDPVHGPPLPLPELTTLRISWRRPIGYTSTPQHILAEQRTVLRNLALPALVSLMFKSEVPESVIWLVPLLRSAPLLQAVTLRLSICPGDDVRGPNDWDKESLERQLDEAPLLLTQLRQLSLNTQSIALLFALCKSFDASRLSNFSVKLRPCNCNVCWLIELRDDIVRLSTSLPTEALELLRRAQLLQVTFGRGKLVVQGFESPGSPPSSALQARDGERPSFVFQASVQEPETYLEPFSHMWKERSCPVYLQIYGDDHDVNIVHLPRLQNIRIFEPSGSALQDLHERAPLGVSFTLCVRRLGELTDAVRSIRGAGREVDMDGRDLPTISRRWRWPRPDFDKDSDQQSETEETLDDASDVQQLPSGGDGAGQAGVQASWQASQDAWEETESERAELEIYQDSSDEWDSW